MSGVARHDETMPGFYPERMAQASWETDSCRKKLSEIKMVRMGRLELPRAKALEPKSSVSTNSTTSARGVGGAYFTLPAWQVKHFREVRSLRSSQGPAIRPDASSGSGAGLRLVRSSYGSER